MPNKLQQDTGDSGNIPPLYHLWIISTADCTGGVEALCVDTLYLCDVMRWINVSLRGASLVHACHCEIETWGWAWHLSSVSCPHIYILMNYSWWGGDAIRSSVWGRGWEYYNANMDIFSTQYQYDLHCLLYISTQYIYPIKLSRGKWYKDEICDTASLGWGHHYLLRSVAGRGIQCCHHNMFHNSHTNAALSSRMS